MRNLRNVGFGLALIALVAFNYRIALAQYKAGPSDLTRGVNLVADGSTNFLSVSKFVKFPVSATNVDLMLSCYNSEGSTDVPITYYFLKSMDGIVWSNATTINLATVASAGGRSILVTNVIVGNYGFFTCSIASNGNSFDAVTNIQAIATYK